MENQELYIMAKQRVVLKRDIVKLKDVANVFCIDAVLQTKAEGIVLYDFKGKQTKRTVLSMLYIIEKIQQLQTNITVESLGESEIVVQKEEKKEKTETKIASIIFVSFICFFGSGFSIMAFHNDIGIQDVFERINRILTGDSNEGLGILNVAYSIGLMVGILIFYNHLGNWKFTKDPTPLEVEMRNYERDVNSAIVDQADREKKELEND